MAILRILLGVVIGVVLAMLIVMAGDWLYMRLFPLPPEVDATNPSSIGAYLASAPVVSLLGLPLTWTIAGGVGALAAAMIARKRWAGWIAGAILFASTLLNLAFIPHPWWMLAAALICVPAAIWAGARAGVR
ncbi:MAG: hypothetical protein NW206_09700 [Hyphomonadaceae bacterium]|nr:hypothetical protein [Hyphomonadaceae bacterium]